MLVQDIMQRGVTVVSPETTLTRLMGLLQRRGIRHLPVVDQGSIVGIISDRDLKGAIASAATSESAANLLSRLDHLTAADIMTRAVVTIAPMFTAEEAARLMVTKKISALPVTEGGRLVGIVTDTDVLHLFVRTLDPQQIFRAIPSVGPELARRIHDTLHVDTLEALEVAAHDGRLASVPGIGPRCAAIIRAALAKMLGRPRSRARGTEEPPIEMLLEVDEEYRKEAAAERFPKIAPRRFNPRGERWLLDYLIAEVH